MPGEGAGNDEEWNTCHAPFSGDVAHARWIASDQLEGGEGAWLYDPDNTARPALTM
jgi:hypothetical protein